MIDIIEQINRCVQEKMAERKIPGVSLALIREGEAYTQGYGLANVELSVPATPDTVYQLASLTKQFTATAVMLLVTQNRMALDESILHYLEDLPSAWQSVTVRHLLNHTSGIKSYTNLPDFRLTIRKDYRPEEIIGLVADLPLEFAPGERFDYNNTGYFLLGTLIEKGSGMLYGDFLQEQIFAPLEMTTTCVNNHSRIIQNRAAGYTLLDDTLCNGDYVSPTQPFAAGALLSTVTDLARWNLALDSRKLLAASDWEQMWSPPLLNDGTPSDYGFGWSVGNYQGLRRLVHGGGIQGFATFMAYFPDTGLAGVLLTNQDNAEVDALAEAIQAILLPA